MAFTVYEVVPVACYHVVSLFTIAQNSVREFKIQRRDGNENVT